MKEVKGIKFNWLISSLFFIGLMITAVALFGITYLGSLSIAELEIERRAERQRSLSGLIFNSHLEQLESQLRTASVDQGLIQAIKDYDSRQATSILELISQNFVGIQSDILILDHERQRGWLNASLSLVDVGAVIPVHLLKSMPPDVWRVYANEAASPATIVAVMAVPILDPKDGRVIARLIGGSSINDSFSLLDKIASILGLDNLAIVYKDKSIASFGELSEATQFAKALRLLAGRNYTLHDGWLFTQSELAIAENGTPLTVLTEEPSDTVNNIRSTYLEIFVPFLLYIAIASITAALLVNRFTAPSLRALIEHATARRASGTLKAYNPGRIAEYNQLGSLFDDAFEAVHKTNAQFRELIDGSLQGVIVHADRKILYANRAMLEILKYPADDPSALVGHDIFMIYASWEHERLHRYRNLRSSGETVPSIYEVQGMCATGDPIWIEQHVRITNWNGRKAIYATVSDVSERKEQERLIEQHANYDMLTNLPNRNLFLDRLRTILGQSDRQDQMGALLMVDLDRFKALNDIYDHECGDDILVTIAGRIERVLKPGETVSRLGGDEFAVILSDVDDEWAIEHRAQEILNVINEKIDLEKSDEAVLTASIGISVFPYDGLNENALMRQADAAMSQAKRAGGNRFRFFSKKMNERATRALQIESSLRKAIEHEQLEIHIQPIVDCVSGSVISCEALVRWTDDDLGQVSPGEFIPVAEETGLIIPLGQIVLTKACIFYQKCLKSGFNLSGISVNISPRQCREDGFINSIKTILEETGMSARDLHLEITESVMFDDSQIDPVSLLKAIKSLGVKISLDDFGTGYSSLSYLKRLPIDTLKIDRSFIRDLENEPDDQALVNAIVTMADSLAIGVICEGVETRDQNDILKRMGCRYIQGYYFAKPMAEDAFIAFLEAAPKAADARKVS